MSWDDDDIDYDDEDADERARHENEVLSPDDGLPDDFNFDNFAMREPYDRVIACLGFGFDWSPFRDDVKPQRELDAKQSIQPYEARMSQLRWIVCTLPAQIHTQETSGSRLAALYTVLGTQVKKYFVLIRNCV